MKTAKERAAYKAGLRAGQIRAYRAAETHGESASRDLSTYASNDASGDRVLMGAALAASTFASWLRRHRKRLEDK